jgi:hypothetical protein
MIQSFNFFLTVFCKSFNFSDQKSDCINFVKINQSFIGTTFGFFKVFLKGVPGTSKFLGLKIWSLDRYKYPHKYFFEFFFFDFFRT